MSRNHVRRLYAASFAGALALLGALAAGCSPESSPITAPSFEVMCFYHPVEYEWQDPGEECFDTDDPNANNPGLYVQGWNQYTCFEDPYISYHDVDLDGTHDECEARLAYEFAPELLTAHDCNFDYGLGRQGGEYFFAAMRRYSNIPSGSRMRIAYLPAYYWDCGNSDDGGGHSGDSEILILDVHYNETWQHWALDSAFLSAHCGTFNDSYCRWYLPNELQWANSRYRGAPQIWVSYGKHANYPTYDACQRGLPGTGPVFEFCSTGPATYRYPIVVAPTEQNVGQRHHRLRDCEHPLQRWFLMGSTAQVDHTALECIWTASPFRGWQRPNSGQSTAYTDVLWDWVGF